MNEKIEDSYESISTNKKIEAKKSYSEPTLSKMGAMQRVTLGGSAAPGDSGTNGLVNP